MWTKRAFARAPGGAVPSPGGSPSLESDPTGPGPSVAIARRIPALDSVRGIAILMVLLYHSNQGGFDTGLVGRFVGRLLRLGNGGVDLFFVLSGFLITGVLLDAKGSPRYFRNFYVRRILRIWPLYYAVLVVTFLLLPAFRVPIDPVAAKYQFWLWAQGTNLIQALKDSDLFAKLSHFWSLAVEEQFYLFWPVLLFFCDRKIAIRVCFSFILLAWACRLGFVLAGHSVAAVVLMPCRMDSIAMGALIALLARKPGGARGLVPFAAMSFIVAGGLMLSLFCLGVVTLGDEAKLLSHFFLDMWLFGGVLILAIHSSSVTLWGRFWKSNFLRFFGKYSYGLYILHYPAYGLVYRVFFVEGLSEKFPSPALMQIGYIACGIGASLLAALASWHLGERQMLRLKDILAPNPPDRHRAVSTS
jgi:peptidoglycan/LPS O-acetylase OafA/YrhL